MLVVCFTELVFDDYGRIASLDTTEDVQFITPDFLLCLFNTKGDADHLGELLAVVSYPWGEVFLLVLPEITGIKFF